MASTTSLRHEFEALIRKAEAEVAANPAAYRRKLALLAALGYAVIFGLLALLIVLLGGSIAAAMMSSAFLILLFKKKLIVLIVVPIWVLGRSLFVRVRAPDGFRLERKNHPQLWKEIDGLRSKLGALPIHNVILTPEMNAAVTQTPRFGIFGPYKNTLVLGLELLMSISPEQARAVLAHEFGHLSGQHGRFGTWIYRKRLTWARIGEAFNQNPAFGTGPLTRFMNWYVPRLAGYSFALARQQEYEADAEAARLTSSQHLATALVLVNARAPITIEAFWKKHWERAHAVPEPEAHTYSRLFHYLKTAPLDRGMAINKLNEALRNKTDYADTHPSLRDRLSALGESPTFSFGQTTAAEAWLGKKLQAILTEFDKTWLDQNSENWVNRHNYAKAALARLDELMRRNETELDKDEAWQKANLIEDFRPDMDPIAAFNAYQLRFPDDPRANFTMGRLILQHHNDSAGLAYLEKAAETPGLSEIAYGIIAGFHQRNNNSQLAETWLRRAEAAHDSNVEAREERHNVKFTDKFKTSRLDEQTARMVATAIKSSSAGSGLKEIWLAEKVLKHYPEDGFNVVLVKPKFFTRGKSEISGKLAEELPRMVPLPDTWIFVVESQETRAIAKKIKAAGRRIDA